MTSFRDQYTEDGQEVRPHISIVCNFTRPTGKKPSLLTFNEVQTFLHEFGHALHGMLSKVTYQSLSGTNVYRDFVELPSQIPAGDRPANLARSTVASVCPARFSTPPSQ